MKKGEETMKTENELIEDFWISQGGKPHWKPDLSFYESSWDMLMPVVDKIEALNKRSIIIEGLTATTSLNVELIPTSLGGYIAKRGQSKIQSVYQLCVEFIKWYSQNS